MGNGVKTIEVADRRIGDGQPCFIAAEVGINHNGDIDLALKSIDAAAEAGADAVKFQNYRTEDFLSDRTLTYEYVSQGKPVVESQWEMFKRCELRPEHLKSLREHCHRRGVVFFSTPTSEEGIRALVEAGAPLLKNGSDFLGHIPLIQAMAQTGLPTVISTGMATVEDIDDAVTSFRAAGGEKLILLHCTSAYPTPRTDLNLRRISALASRFDCLPGFSDHSEGTAAAAASVGLGACFIEKHFTLDRNLPGPDHRFSSDPRELAELVRSVREAETMLGSSEFRPASSEERGRTDFRLSCVAARDLPAGHRLSKADIAFRRPGTGVLPREVGSLLEKRLKHAVAAGAALQLGDVE